MEKTEFHEFQGALIPDDDFPAPWELWSSNNSDIYPIYNLFLVLLLSYYLLFFSELRKENTLKLPKYG